MRRIKVKRIGRISVTLVTVILLAALMLSIDSIRTMSKAASLTYIDQIVAASGTFNILEIVPDTAAASFGYYIDGQEPNAGWKTEIAAMTSPSARSTYVNTQFSRLASADKEVLGSGTSTPLKYTYYDDVNKSYYTEAYTVADPQNWSKLHLNANESATLVGTMTAAANGAYRAGYSYTLKDGGGGGYVQNIAYFAYTAAPTYGQGTYYYNPVFTKITSGMDLTGWDNVVIYTLDASNNYVADSNKMTVKDYKLHGGFDQNGNYYYVDPTQTGAPGNFKYAAVVSKTDNDDAPGDGYTTPASGNSYFSRTITDYTYVGTGGNFNFSPSGNTSYTVNYTDIYYKAGYVNNNLFKTLVFGLNGSTMNVLSVTVTVRKASEVTSADISGAGMIYLSSGTDLTKSGVTTTYSAANDIPDARAVEIYNYAANQNPVIIDYSIIQGINLTNNPTPSNNIQKLCLLCLQSSLTTTTQTSLSGLTIDVSTLSYLANDNDKTLVNNNVYCFKAFNDQTLGAQPNAFNLETSHFGTSFTPGVYSDGFTAVLTTIQNENFLRQIAGQQDLLPENVTIANAIRHIINYKGQRQTNKKAAIKVLDLEPAKVTASTWLTTATVKGWINNTITDDNKITIVHMTTGEFVGKIEDIVETYDMIYIGMSTETLNAPSGNTVYNDTSMNGLIYSNIGDKYYATIEMAGIRSQDYLTVNGTKAINNTNGTNANLFRFSGNDITKTAVTEIQKFTRAGYPIILADGFVSGSAINTSKVDSSSYMYEAVNGVYNTYANVMTQTYAAAHTADVIKYMNVTKPDLKLTAKPVEYADNASVTLAADTDGYYYLKYTMKISNVTDPTPISTTYDCRLFLDINADGRFADNEELKDIAVYRVSDGALVLPLKDAGNNEYYALSADVDYTVKRQMPNNYVGIIPWKLEVIKNGADQIHASQQGFTRIAAGGNYQTIKVLQIMQGGTSGSNLNLSTQLTVNQSGTNTQLKGLDGKFYTGIYGKLIADLQDFRVNITEIDNNVLETKGDSATILKYLDDYDMLIIGFNDCYNGIAANSATAIVNYIGQGKSVLFTHDTTSLTQVPSSNYPMVINGTAPTVKTLKSTEVIYNSDASVYRSADGNINWYSSKYDTTCPPYIRQNDPTYVVLMKSSSNVSSNDEKDYYGAMAPGNIYKVTGSSYSAIANPSSFDNFKTTTGTDPVIYVKCTSANGWYGTGSTYGVGHSGYRYNLITTNNFTKFVSGGKYTCTGLTYSDNNNTTQPQNNNQSLTTSSYSYIMQSIFEVNPNSYSVIGTYTGSNNTYSISAKTWYPATGAPFLQTTLYDKDPANPYTMSTLPNNITDWGYYFNTVIRDTVGLDRYGVTNPVLKSLVDVSTTMPYQDITTVLQNNRSVAFTPKSARASTVPEFQGYTNYALIRFAGSGNNYKYTNNTYTNRETTNVSQVNKGQITTYPYNVNTFSFGGNDSTITGYGGSYMQIGLTHEQYFQINMNTDDIVVWYNLSNYSSYSSGVVYYDTNSYYDDVPNDCVNAYYIYNKGNVTYSGVGHTAAASYYTGSNIGQQYINEAKLFVNTMIAAYRSAKQAPSVKIKKDANGTSDLHQRFMVVDEGTALPNDSVVLEENFGSNDVGRAVYFRIYDTNLGANNPITASFYVTDDVNGTVDPAIDGTKKVSQLVGTAYYNGANETIKTFNANDGSLVTTPTLKGGYVYRINLPDYVITAGNVRIPVLDQMKSDTTYSFRIYVKITTPGFAPSADYLELQKQQLFPLA